MVKEGDPISQSITRTHGDFQEHRCTLAHLFSLGPNKDDVMQKDVPKGKDTTDAFPQRIKSAWSNGRCASFTRSLRNERVDRTLHVVIECAVDEMDPAVPSTNRLVHVLKHTHATHDLMAQTHLC